MASPVETVLEQWIHGKEIARREFEHGTVVVITQNLNEFTMLRAFTIGDRAEVSCDLSGVPADQLVRHLLERTNY
jgi:hypothetical protein